MILAILLLQILLLIVIIADKIDSAGITHEILVGLNRITEYERIEKIKEDDLQDG